MSTEETPENAPIPDAEAASLLDAMGWTDHDRIRRCFKRGEEVQWWEVQRGDPPRRLRDGSVDWPTAPRVFRVLAEPPVEGDDCWVVSEEDVWRPPGVAPFVLDTLRTRDPVGAGIPRGPVHYTLQGAMDEMTVLMAFYDRRVRRVLTVVEGASEDLAHRRLVDKEIRSILYEGMQRVGAAVRDTEIPPQRIKDILAEMTQEQRTEITRVAKAVAEAAKIVAEAVEDNT